MYAAVTTVPVVRARGFEPLTSRLRTEYSGLTELHPDGAPGGSRTLITSIRRRRASNDRSLGHATYDRRVAGVEPACASVAGPYEPSVEAFQSFDRRRGALTGTRTRDLALTKGVLFQLSYEGGAGSFARGTYGLCTDPHRSDVAPYCLFTDRLLYPS